MLGRRDVLEDDARLLPGDVQGARAECARRVAVGAAVGGAGVAVARAVGDGDRAAQLVRAAAVGADDAEDEAVAAAVSFDCR